MLTKKNVKYLFFIFPHFLFAQSPNFSLIFGQKYKDALTFTHQYQGTISKGLKEYGISPHFGLAIVFPELMRYNPTRDAAETMGNRLLYVNFGEEYSNFSIGCFQMKPTFVEQLEKEVKEKSELSVFLPITQYKSTDIFEIRKERLNRLSQLTWQVKYLACFLTLIENRFPLSDKNIAEKVKFYATAYNRGFFVSESEILKWTKKANFPDVEHASGKLYVYGEIAAYFFLADERK